MSLITRCPACATMFKVVPDQLRISAGWVRCGVCAEVFDAAAQMLLAAESKELESAVSASIPVVPVSPPEPSEVMQDAAEQSAFPSGFDAVAGQELPVVDVAVVAEPRSGSVEPSADEPVAELADEAVGTAVAAPPAGSNELNQALHQAPPRADALFARPASVEQPVSGPEQEAASPDESGYARFAPGRPRKEAAPTEKKNTAPSDSESWLDAIARDASAEDETLEPAEEVPSFVRQAQRNAFWRSRGVRSAIGLAVVLVALGLGWQWMVQQRDWLAAREPRLTPMLELLCRPAGCVIAPYRDLNAIVIDGSSFQRMSPNSFQLGFGLRNKGSLPVATPALELTLTDAQDQALLRRVLKVQDLSAPATLAAQGEFNGTSALSVDVADPTAIVGYRLVAFYP